jgi:hypothetical protein
MWYIHRPGSASEFSYLQLVRLPAVAARPLELTLTLELDLEHITISCYFSASFVVRLLHVDFAPNLRHPTARVDGLDDQHHPISSLITGGPGPYIPYPSHSTLSDMGPDQWMLMLDCRYVTFCACFFDLCSPASKR